MRTRPPVVLATVLLVLWTSPQAQAGGRQIPEPEPAPTADVPGEQVPVQPEGDPAAPPPPIPSDAPEATTTTVAVLGPTAASQEKSESEKANQRVQLVVISLVVLAVVVAGVTVVFWRRTSPSRVASPEAGAVTGRFDDS